MKTLYGTVVGVLHGDKILILRRAPNESNAGLWQFVCGTYETTDHTLLNTALRELPEETGIMTNQLQYVGDIQKSIDDIFYKGNVYLARSADHHVRISNEHDRFAWIAQDELADYNLDDGTKLSLELL